MGGSVGLSRVLAAPGVAPLASSVLATTLGTGMITTGGLVFFVQSAGLATADIVVGMTAAGVVGPLAAVFLGDLADRLGARAVCAGMLLVLAGLDQIPKRRRLIVQLKGHVDDRRVGRS